MATRGENIKKSDVDAVADAANANSKLSKHDWQRYNLYTLSTSTVKPFAFKDRSQWTASTDSWIAELSRIRLNLIYSFSTAYAISGSKTFYLFNRYDIGQSLGNVYPIKQGQYKNLSSKDIGLLNTLRHINGLTFTSKSQSAVVRYSLFPDQIWSQEKLEESKIESDTVWPNQYINKRLKNTYDFEFQFDKALTLKFNGEMLSDIRSITPAQISSVVIDGPCKDFVSVSIIPQSAFASYAVVKFLDGHPMRMQFSIEIKLVNPQQQLQFSEGTLVSTSAFWSYDFTESTESKDIASSKTYSVSIGTPFAVDRIINRTLDRVTINPNVDGFWKSKCPAIQGLSQDPPARGGVLHPQAYSYGPIPYDDDYTGNTIIDYLDKGLHRHISQMIYDQNPLYPWQRDTDQPLAATNISGQGRAIYSVVAKRIASEVNGVYSSNIGAELDVEIGCIQNGSFITFETVKIPQNQAASPAIYPNWLIFDPVRIAYRCPQKVEIFANVCDPIDILSGDYPVGYRLTGSVLAAWVNDTIRLIEAFK